MGRFAGMMLIHLRRAWYLPLAVLALAADLTAASAGQKGASRLTIAFPDGSTVLLEPFRTDRKLGISDAQCGVIIEGRRLTVIGEGEMESYSCIGLAEAGALPPLAGQRRIGLIYDVASPNAHFRTAAILLKNSGEWNIDSASAGSYDDRPEAQSLRALAGALARDQQ